MLPKNWDNITIEQYVAVYKTLDKQPKDDEANWRLLIKRICLLTGLEPEWVEDNLTMNDLAKMQDFLKSRLPKKLVKYFRFNGKRYRVDIDPTKYNAGRYMSVMNQLKDDKIDNLHKVIFQVCTETDWKGNDIEANLDTIAHDIESFKQLPMKIANPIMVFFSLLSNELTSVILESSIERMKKAQESLQQEIEYLKDSDG